MTQTWKNRTKKALYCKNDYIRCGMAEFFGTFVLVLMLDAMAANATFHQMLPDGGRKPNSDQLYLAVGAGLAVMFGVLVSGGVSGAHLNPALSLTFSLMGRLTWKKCIIYMIAQYAGALTAVCCHLWDLFRNVTGPTATASIFATYPIGEHLTWATAFFDQILATAVLMFGVLAIVDQKNWNIKRGSIPIYIGLLITSIVLSLGYNSGVAMNPARDFMPRLFTYLAGWGEETFSYWNYSWFFVPIIGPHLGSAVGALLYQGFIGAHWPEDDSLKQRGHQDIDMEELRTPLNHVNPNPHIFRQNGKYSTEQESHRTSHVNGFHA